MLSNIQLIYTVKHVQVEAILSEQDFFLRINAGFFILEKIHRCTTYSWLPYNVSINLVAVNNSCLIRNAFSVQSVLFIRCLKYTK